MSDSERTWHILLVDDEEAITTNLAPFLERAGFKVSIATDGAQVVGITGERVAPNLYVALGIRGDTMHTWGMKGARYVVAVHPDPDAPLLKQADVAIVGDPAKVAKELTEALSKN
jgi:CheY-like chemotaxis protein